MLNDTTVRPPKLLAKPLVLTTGDPAGIGPDLCLDALNSDCPRRLIVIGDRNVLTTRAAILNRDINAADYEKQPDAARAVWHCPVQQKVEVGVPTPANAGHVLQQLTMAAQGCRQGTFAAMVTAPVSKEMILAAGHAFTGQTEYIADAVGVSRPVMLLAGTKLRVALATTHLPLQQVAAALTAPMLQEILSVLHRDLPRYCQTAHPPRINVCGLNPHAGEGGYLGDEEQTIIRPALAQARANGITANGPYPADTIIAQSLMPAADCVLAMYHDQGLPAVKLLDFDHTVNITLGLPFLRTSPDHGIAADLAGRGTARPHSMREALALAARQK